MLLAIVLGCVYEGDKSIEDSLAVFNHYRVLNVEWDYVEDNIQYIGQQAYNYEDNSLYYTSSDWTEMVDGESTTFNATATHSQEGLWDTLTITKDGAFYSEEENFVFDRFSNVTYVETNGTIEGFEDAEDINLKDIEFEYESHSTLKRRKEHIYHVDGSPVVMTTNTYYLSQFEPCPHNPMLFTTEFEEYDSQGNIIGDTTAEFDAQGFPTRVYSTTDNWSTLYHFEFDDQGKPIRQTLTVEETGYLFYMYEFSYSTDKIMETVVTRYHENGEIQEQFLYKHNFTPFPWDNAFHDGNCTLTKQDMSGVHQWDYWKLEQMTTNFAQYINISTSGEETGYWEQYFEQITIAEERE